MIWSTSWLSYQRKWRIHRSISYILLTARVHSGETQESWSMQGCINFLMSYSPQASFPRARLKNSGFCDVCTTDVIYGPGMSLFLCPSWTHTAWLMVDIAAALLLERIWTDWFSPNEHRRRAVTLSIFMSSISQRRWQNCAPSPGLGFFCDCHGRVARCKLTTGRVVMAIDLGVNKNSYTLAV
jgi:hypothetical protein